MAEIKPASNPVADLTSYRNARNQPTDSYMGPTSGDGGGGGMETWPQSVDRQLSDLRSETKWLLRGGLAAMVGLAVAGSGLYLTLAGDNRDLMVGQQQTLGELKALDARLNGKIALLLERTATRPTSASNASGARQTGAEPESN